MTLYELTNEMMDLLALLALLALLEENPPEDEAERAKYQEAIQNTLESLELETIMKVDAYCQVLAQLKADAEALKKEKLRLAAGARSRPGCSPCQPSDRDRDHDQVRRRYEQDI